MGAYGGFGLAGGFGGLWMLVVWALIIGAVVWAASGFFASRPADGTTDALAILQRRFASGEISQAEYESARRALA